jgi:hypothetical protein
VPYRPVANSAPQRERRLAERSELDLDADEVLKQDADARASVATQLATLGFTRDTLPPMKAREVKP